MRPIMKFLKVNMSNKTIGVQEVPERYRGLGGRGLTSVMINTEVPPKCDPLGPDNTLIVAPGLLSSTSLVNTSRISIGAKSPLTGGIKESNAGGTVAAAFDSTGLCFMAYVALLAPEAGEAFLKVLNAKLGTEPQ
jgi:aldehyde:ferredoxin oxidoreductase